MRLTVSNQAGLEQDGVGDMSTMRKALLASLAGAAMMTGLALPALAQGGDAKRELAWSWNIGGTTDYIFRGFSQSARKPAFQAGADLTYGLFYAGFWGSSIDFGQYPDTFSGTNRDVGGFAEID